MSVRIRLRRMGRKKQPHYRVVVADGAAPRDGRIVENLGYYRPQSTPARLVLDLERVDYWIARGAEPSDTVASLVRKARTGGDDTVAVGEPDLEAQRKRETEALAAKRAAERTAREAPAHTEPEDVEGGEAAGSATGETAAVAVAEGEEAAVAAVEADAPEQAPEESVKKQAAAPAKKGGKSKAAAAEGAGGEEQPDQGTAAGDEVEAPEA